MSSENNPIDSVEELILSQEWPYERLSSVELACDVAGRWCDYRLHFVWREEERILQFFLLFDLTIPPSKRDNVGILTAQLNSNIYMGNFEIFPQESCPVFRHGLLLPGTRTLSESLLAEVIDYALSACEKYYPAFQFVILGDKKPHDAATMAMIDTVGEA